MTTAAHRLIVENVEWARKYARSFSRRLPYRHRGDDLESEAAMGLIEAASSYRPCAVPFRAFAWTRVKGAMIDYCRNDHLVKQHHADRRAFTGNFAFTDIAKYTHCLPDESSEIEDAVIAADLLEQVESNVDERTRRIIRRCLAGGSYTDAARELGISGARITQLLTPVRKQYREIAP